MGQFVQLGPQLFVHRALPYSGALEIFHIVSRVIFETLGHILRPPALTRPFRLAPTGRIRYATLGKDVAPGDAAELYQAVPSIRSASKCSAALGH